MDEIDGFEEWFVAHNQKRLNAGFYDYSSAEKMLACVAWQAARAKPVMPDGLASATRSMGRLLLRFESSDQLNDFYYTCKDTLAAAPKQEGV